MSLENERVRYMGVASLVLGIISLIAGWIPFVCWFVFILAVIGLILGIVDCVKKSKANVSGKGMGIAGLILSAIAIPIIIIMSFASLGMLVAIMEGNDVLTNYNDYYYNDYYDYDYDYDYNDYYDWYDRYYNNL